MLVAKIIICVLTFVVFFVVRKIYENNHGRNRVSDILTIVAGILGITFCVLLIATDWNLFTIPEILLFISMCIYILLKKEYVECESFQICITFTLIAFIIAVIMYGNNIKECEVPDVSITKRTLICAKDNSPITGSISGGIFYVSGSLSEKSVYQYYYKLEDGGIKLGTIPTDLTTIYYIEAGKEAYLETVVTTYYCINNNDNPPTRNQETSQTAYKLYVPEGSITNVYEFDTE